MKQLYLIISLLILILATACEEKTNVGFGITETDFVEDSIYKTKTDGLLCVEVVSGGTAVSYSIFADEKPEPETEISYILTYGTSTKPLRKNMYWKVSYTGDANSLEFVEKFTISWTPLE